uniref:Putative portal protein n=1 Tax=viral metagenome TaxID=1070528 RepID=A0A6M3JWI8_9ZZZZ
MAELIKLADRVHPLYEYNKETWELYFDSVKGGDEFITEDNLFSHRLEDPEDYDERLERGYYLNYCDTIPSIYNSFIFRSNIERPPDDSIKDFRANVDGRGTDISAYIKRAGYFSSVFGVMHILVDINSEGGRIISKADEKNLRPYCSMIYPTKLRDWAVDDFGNFIWVLIESEYYDDKDPLYEREIRKHYKLITKEYWKVEDEEGNLVESGINSLGYIPIITMYHKDLTDDKVGESMLKDIVYVNRTIMNWCSCIDEMIERQTFSQLVLPDDGTLAEASETGDDPLIRVSTSSVWTANAESRWPPQFISPNVENITTIWSLVLDHVKEMFRMAGLIGSSDDLYVSRSGRAAQMGFLGVNSSLAEKAAKYQEFENTISKMVYEYMGRDMDDFKEVKYPDSFDVTALSEEITTYFSIMERNFSTTLNKTIMRSIARRSTPLAPSDIRLKIEEEIESNSGIVEPVNALGNQDGSNNVGNPNAQNISNTFRGQKDKKFDEVTKRKKE